MSMTTPDLALPSPNFRTTPAGGRLVTTYDLICNRPAYTAYLHRNRASNLEPLPRSIPLGHRDPTKFNAPQVTQNVHVELKHKGNGQSQTSSLGRPRSVPTEAALSSFTMNRSPFFCERVLGIFLNLVGVGSTHLTTTSRIIPTIHEDGMKWNKKQQVTNLNVKTDSG
ncbi:hypothetical protein AVEN_128457-1 [Araneus ventricosus]|uniref:Uncharacterized protein n=1 Tax=Araneus ventricosus TaxID=182803 RepID=A0A4Y2MXS7_ARAVE|nr:hypothetical protein AVEN_128457-1 [Araneus ventricosus]